MRRQREWAWLERLAEQAAPERIRPLLVRMPKAQRLLLPGALARCDAARMDAAMPGATSPDEAERRARARL